MHDAVADLSDRVVVIFDSVRADVSDGGSVPRVQLMQKISQHLQSVNVMKQPGQALAIEAVALRNFDDRIGHQATEVGMNRAICLPKHLIHAMWNEHHLVAGRVVVNAVVVPVHHVAVPVPDEYFQRHKGNEPIYIQRFV